MKQKFIFIVCAILLMDAGVAQEKKELICEPHTHQCRKCEGTSVKQIDSSCLRCQGKGVLRFSKKCSCGSGEIEECTQCSNGYVEKQKIVTYCEKKCVKCSVCEGDGGWYNYYGYWFACRNCRGNGVYSVVTKKQRIEYYEVRCSYCNGSTKVTVKHTSCQKCKGKGMVYWDENCPNSCNKGKFKVSAKCDHDELEVERPHISWLITSDSISHNYYKMTGENERVSPVNISSESSFKRILVTVNGKAQEYKLPKKRNGHYYQKAIPLKFKLSEGENVIRVYAENQFGYYGCIEKRFHYEAGVVDNTKGRTGGKFRSWVGRTKVSDPWRIFRRKTKHCPA